MDLQSLIDAGKERIGQIIQKPKMNDKLLSKPPFRFLHDTISAMISATGLGEGLFSGSELDSASLAEKQDKIAYLEKMFLFVGICKGAALDVRAAKVVAGLEPENTNMFLLAYCDCIADGNLDNAEAVRRTLAQENPSSPPRKRNNAAPVAEAKGGGDGGGGRGSKSQPPESDAKGGSGGGGGFDFKTLDVDAPGPGPNQGGGGSERGKSRGGTRGGKPQQATADIGIRGIGGSSGPNLDPYIETCDGSEEKTQEYLGELITRPKLTSKLLSKPPFRFLHDIIMEIMRSTGFGTGLFTEEEMDSAKVAEKTQKLAFLDKILKLVGLQLNTLVEAKSVKIVAGMDPQATNTFLQLLAVAAKYSPDSMAAVRTVLELDGGEAPPMMASAPVPTSVPPPAEEKQPRTARQPAPAAAEVSPPPQFHAEPKQDRDSPYNAGNQQGMTDDRREIDEKTAGDDGGNDDEKRSARPTTARRRPPKVKETAKEVTAKDTAPAAKKAEGILIDGQVDDDDDDAVPEETRLADDLAADAKGLGNADPQSKLVKDILSRQAEQEVARKGNTQIVNESKDSPVEGGNIAGGSGIRLTRGKVAQKKGSTGSGGGGLGETDMERLRGAIQVLVQHTGPLGTCMDFIQEDIGLMSAELHRWEDECSRYEAEAEEERRKSKEQLQPLQGELADLVEQIKEKCALISATKASIAKNDDKIQQMLKLMTTA